MKADLLIVQICDFPGNGQGFFRYHEPSRHLGRFPGVVVVDCHPHHRLLPSLLGDADVLILQGFDSDYFPLIEQRQAEGRATVFEANDNYLDVQAFNPHAQQWLDRSVQEELRQIIAGVDAVQTSTENLAQRWDGVARRTVVFPNHLSAIPPLSPALARPLTIGWAGSITHLADWYHLAPFVQKWLEAPPAAGTVAAIPLIQTRPCSA